MTNRTLTSLYTSRDDAERARKDLNGAGVSGNIDLHDKSNHDEGFMEKVKSFFGGHDDTHVYNEGISRGHTLLTANVPEQQVDKAALVLEGTNAVDLDREQENWRNQGWTGRASASGGKEEVIPIVEERLAVGKREVERGGVRVRTYMVETPVTDSIGLREEHVTLERRPVDREANAGDAGFKDCEISMTETAEEAVVAKNAFVREELVVRKDVSERTEEIRDTVRRTKVEVDDTTAGGRNKSKDGTSPAI
jgi:uncharacterized protein (TIGR02271 family)